MNKVLQLLLSTMIVLTGFSILVEAANEANSLNGLIGSAGITVGILYILADTGVFNVAKD